jgi:hypothetical protein
LSAEQIDYFTSKSFHSSITPVSPRTSPFLFNLNFRKGDDIKAKIEAFIDPVPGPADLKFPAMQCAMEIEAV